jgi:phosphohistidine swiveling domain-containing protein
MEKLLQPEEITISQQMRLALLSAVLKEKSGNKKDGQAGLRQIFEDYRWLNFGWSGPEFDFSFFEQMYNELLLKPVADLNSEIDSLKSTSARVLAEKNKLRKILKIDQKHFRYIKDVSLLSWLKLYRKDILFAVNWLTFHILEPYQKKHNYTHKDLSFITLDEVPELLNGTMRLTKKDFAERFHFSVLVPGEKYAYVGENAKKFLSRFDLANTDGPEEKTLKLLNGMTACLGKTGDWVYGTVRIVNTPADMKNMTKGDILVSAATTPDILPAMKLAGAIVTDQGGITCHAAIVSRELNLPCLIGTKYATKIFKDGDKVIVCPRHAYIKFQ